MGTVDGIRRPTNRAQQLRRDATPAERTLRTQLSDRKLGYKFSRQMPVGPFICDFLCRSQRLAIELDGDSHATTTDYDHRRDTFILRNGIRTVRFSNADVAANLEGVVAAIVTALAEGPPPTPPASGRGE